ncbi:UNVERIFIED_CONTAM: hypothetical protein NCL1_15133 [Trichonephila clavipes]
MHLIIPKNNPASKKQCISRTQASIIGNKTKVTKRKARYRKRHATKVLSLCMKHNEIVCKA